MSTFVLNGSAEDETDGNMRWDHFRHCPHFTGKWVRAMPLISFCVFLTFMVIVSGRRKRCNPRTIRDEFQGVDVESRVVRPPYTIRTLNETTPLLKAEIWKQARQDPRDATAASLSKQLICTVCLDPIKPRHDIRELVCLHIFHCTCIESWWLRGNALCPLCRQAIIIDNA